MEAKSLVLELSSDTLAVCRLAKGDVLPIWALGEGFFSITQTSDELSVVCADAKVPNGIRAERGWRCFKVQGPLDFALTGILSSLLAPLAQAKISIFAVSTFDTDYILVRSESLDQAVACLVGSGHTIQR